MPLIGRIRDVLRYLRCSDAWAVAALLSCLMFLKLLLTPVVTSDLVRGLALPVASFVAPFAFRIFAWSAGCSGLQLSSNQRLATLCPKDLIPP